MLACQAPLDGSLRLVQPVQRTVQIVGAALTHAQQVAQRGGGGVVVQRAMRDQLGRRLEHARHQHGLHPKVKTDGTEAFAVTAE